MKISLIIFCGVLLQTQGALLPFTDVSGSRPALPAVDERKCQQNTTIPDDIKLAANFRSTNLSVCNDGSIQIGSDERIIAPYFSSKPAHSGWIVVESFRSGDDLLRQVGEQVKQARGLSSFSATVMVVVTWDRVEEYYQNTDKTATFQVVLIGDGRTAFALLNYGELSWPAGGTLTNVKIGIFHNSATAAYEVPISDPRSIQSAFPSNVNQTGSWLLSLTDISGVCEIAMPCGPQNLHNCTNTPSGGNDCSCTRGFAPVEINPNAANIQAICQGYPYIESTPAVRWRIANSKLQFYCNCTPPTDTKNARIEFITYWKNENKTVFIDSLPIENLPSILDDANWNNFQFGKSVACGIRLKYGNGDAQTKIMWSRPFFVGLQIAEPPFHNLSLTTDGSPRTISLSLTVPIVCTAQPCTLTLGFTDIPRTGNRCTKAVRFQTCKLSIEGIIANNMTHLNDDDSTIDWKKTFTVQVYGAGPNTYQQGSDQSDIQIISNTQQNPELTQWTYPLPFFQATVTSSLQNVAHKSCMSANDPHMRTFDGNPYELQFEGTFLLYKHSRFSQEIQLRFRSCLADGTAPTCNCGVAVRSGNTTFVFDACGLSPNNPSLHVTRVEILGCDQAALGAIQNSDGSYTITLPSGTRVIIQAPVYYLNIITTHVITIEPSPLDYDAVSGACGTLNNYPIDDFKTKSGVPAADLTAFIESWRVAKEDDLIVNTTKATQRAAAANRTTVLTHIWECSMTSSSTGNLVEDVEVPIGSACGSKLATSSTIRRICQITLQPGRGKRLVSSNDLEIPALVYPMEAAPQNNSYLQWTNGWNESLATDFCRRKILDDSAIHACSGTVAGLDTDFFLNGCILDIHATGGTDFAQGNVDGLQQECMREVLKNETLWEPSPDNSSVLVPPKLITNLICPNSCTGHGQCANGTCVCQEPWIGVGCSSNKFAAPEGIFDLDGGICQINKRPCESMIVFGRGFSADMGNGSCLIKSFQVKVSEEAIYLGEGSFDVTVLNPGMAVCALPSTSLNVFATQAVGYRIRVSNNGYNYSNEISIIKVDSSCMSCSPEGNFTCVQLDVCIIENTCYRHGETKTSSSCEQCDTSRNKNAWTDVCLQSQPLDSLIGVYIGVPIAGFVLISAAVIFGVWYCMKRSKKTSTYVIRGCTACNCLEKEIPDREINHRIENPIHNFDK